MEITFLRPLYLTFLLSIPFFIMMHFLILRHIKRRALKFANYEAIEKATGGQILNKNMFLLFIRLSALVMMIFSVAGTTLWYVGNASDSDYVIAIDASSSMLADDFSPNRFAAARQAAIDFVDKIPPYSKVGLVSFSGTSEVDLQLTDDRSTTKEKIREMSIKSVGGTDLGEAIITSTNLLTGTEKSKIIILLTDGQSNVGTDPLYGAEYANSHRATVFTIGIATPEGGKFSKVEAISTLDAASLIAISDATGGKYYYAANIDELNSAYDAISQTSEKKLSFNLQLPLMLTALFMLFFEWGLVNTKFRTLP